MLVLNPTRQSLTLKLVQRAAKVDSPNEIAALLRRLM